ncbi:MAG: hypothetical protein LUI87_07545 [Lachnospiraceae bacterium]|nr:hypothetical protein [Lachnospiraceae bacterium]
MAKEQNISRQIAVYKTDKGLLEFNNKLLPAPKDTPWHIHAEGKGEGYSLIQLIALDYSKGKGDKCISVYANVKPEDIKFLFMKLCFGFESVKFYEQKIFKDDGGGFVTSLQIERSERNEKGEVLRLPWSVRIGNGTGVVAYNRNGGQYCERDSYDEEKAVKVRLDDRAFFSLLSRTCAVINAFEMSELYREKDIRNFQSLFRLINGKLDTLFGAEPALQKNAVRSVKTRPYKEKEAYTDPYEEHAGGFGLPDGTGSSGTYAEDNTDYFAGVDSEDAYDVFKEAA